MIASAPASAPSVFSLETMTVTGSNIKRLDQERILPVTVLSAAELEVRNASQAADLLTALPEITGLPNNETATLGATARGDNASLSLRGLASSDTLLLLDGRRLAPHPISQFEGSTLALTPNVNQLPNRGIDRIEVLRDGASSVYGADAVAGVVNYVMAKNFRGTEVQTSFGQTRYRDGAEVRATLTHGFEFAGGRGRGMVVADFYNRQAMFARDRPFAADADHSAIAPAPWNVATVATGGFNARSAVSYFGSFSLGAPTGTDAFGAVTSFAGARPAGVPASLVATSGQFFLAPQGGAAVAIQSATPSRAGITHDYYWNNNATRVIQPQSTRANGFASGDYDLTDRISVFFELSLYQARSVTYREPDGISASTDGDIVVPTGNPYNPFGDRFWSTTGAPNADGTPRLTGTPSAVLITNKRLSDLPTRTDFVTDSVDRVVVGLRGKLSGSWSWESALLWSSARVIEYEAGTTRKSLLVSALNQTDPAKAFNPFTRTFAVQNGALVVTGPFTNPDSVTSTFRSPFVRNGITKLGSGDFHASGDVLPLWGGNVIGAAFGGEFRYESYDDYRPPYAGLNPPGSGLDPTSDDFLGFSPNVDTHANRHLTAAHVETIVPLVGRDFTLPLVHSLELSASARYESYSDFGDTTKPKYGAAWRPTPWLMVRSSYNQGFHAPNLAQVFTGTLIRSQPGVTDSYRSAVTGLPTDGSSNRRSLASGNRDLRPENSTGRSAGLVIEVPRLRGLSLSIDYWEIRQRNVITGPTAQEAVNSDAAALQSATQAALGAGQSLGVIDLGSATASYKGDPAVIRLPVTQADRDFFAGYNARQIPGNQVAVVGAIDTIRLTYFNRAEQFSNGFDFDLNYRFPQWPVGSFTFDTAWTLLNSFFAYNSAGALRTELLGTNSFSVGGVDPRWRGTTTLSWRRNQWGAGLGFYYIGRYTDSNATTTAATYATLGLPAYIQPVFTGGAYSYRYVVHDSKSYNAFVSYRVSAQNRWLERTTFRLGVNNLTDSRPPLSADSRGYDPAAYNAMARGLAWSVQLTKSL
jgi:iron complex outermembrane receptor protein